MADAADEAAKRLVEIRNPDGVPPHEASVWVASHWVDACCPAAELAANIRAAIAHEIRAAIEAARREEREACAKVCDEHSGSYARTAETVPTDAEAFAEVAYALVDAAKAIRERGE